MTLFDQQTETLPPPPYADESDPVRSGSGLAIALLAGLVLVLLVAGIFIAETLARAEAEQTIEDGVRSALALSDAERVHVEVGGPVLLQNVRGRLDSIRLTVYSFPTGRANADLTVSIEGLHGVGDSWGADRISGAVTVSAAQATALFLPAEAQGRMRVGFSGGDMVISPSAPGAGTTFVSAAVTPRLENGRLSMGLTSMMIGDKTLTLDEVAAQTGVDPAVLQPASVCLAEGMPRFLQLRDVRITDQQLRFEVDGDPALLDTAAGDEPGSCP